MEGAGSNIDQVLAEINAGKKPTRRKHLRSNPKVEIITEAGEPEAKLMAYHLLDICQEKEEDDTIAELQQILKRYPQLKDVIGPKIDDLIKRLEDGLKTTLKNSEEGSFPGKIKALKNIKSHFNF